MQQKIKTMKITKIYSGNEFSAYRKALSYSLQVVDHREFDQDIMIYGFSTTPPPKRKGVKRIAIGL